ncbi:rplX [Symbiodinium pilosum]|uniref:RplX protein n=1 Tax=Symbiodinium pilosum TaxID=2952 RepID=A0A812TSQ5_SYMPI|nr:rplX [Symbiodinium pilosum]
MAAAKRKLRQVLTSAEFARIKFLVGDIQQLNRDHALLRDGFNFIVCCGVLHHLADPSLGLQRLASLLVPDGVLQLATYSTFSFQTWRPQVEAWLEKLPAARQILPGSRTPSRPEVRALRREVLAAPKEDPESKEAREMLIHFPEFFTYSGLLDLLFHPAERTFTLRELLEGPVAAARLSPLGVFFLDVNTELVARRSFAKRFTKEPDVKMADLRLWHSLEEEEPEIFGRMHGIWLVRSRLNKHIAPAFTETRCQCTICLKILLFTARPIEALATSSQAKQSAHGKACCLPCLGTCLFCVLSTNGAVSVAQSSVAAAKGQ